MELPTWPQGPSAAGHANLADPGKGVSTATTIVLDQANGLAQGQAGGDAGDTRNVAEAFGVQNRCRKQRKDYPGYHDCKPRERPQGKTRTCAQEKKNQESPAHFAAP
jgi:hypothetical protein